MCLNHVILVADTRTVEDESKLNAALITLIVIVVIETVIIVIFTATAILYFGRKSCGL